MQEPLRNESQPEVRTNSWLRAFQRHFSQRPRITLVFYGLIWGVCLGNLNMFLYLSDFSQLCSDKQSLLLWCQVNRFTFGGLVSNWTQEVSYVLVCLFSIIHLEYLERISGQRFYGRAGLFVAFGCSIIGI
jgi:hypothetical protein